MEVIADELWKNNVNIDKKILTDHINDVLDRHKELYDEMVVRLRPDELSDIFLKMNVNNLGRAMAYLTLVYRMNIPEDVRREAVRLTASVLREIGVAREIGAARVEEESFTQRLFSVIGRVLLELI